MNVTSKEPSEVHAKDYDDRHSWPTERWRGQPLFSWGGITGKSFYYTQLKSVSILDVNVIAPLKGNSLTPMPKSYLLKYGPCEFPEKLQWRSEEECLDWNTSVGQGMSWSTSLVENAFLFPLIKINNNSRLLLTWPSEWYNILIWRFWTTGLERLQALKHQWGMRTCLYMIILIIIYCSSRIVGIASDYCILPH